MNPKRYTIEINGKFTTIRTCGGPVGAYRGLTNERITDYKLNVDGTAISIVNGHEVTELDFFPIQPIPGCTKVCCRTPAVTV